MRFAGQVVTERSGFFLRIGRGVGEVAPLPGLHRETAAECLELLRLGGPGAVGRFPPALAFGVSCALALDRGEPILAKPLAARCPVNGLFTGDAADAEQALIDRRLAGFRVVKVKVGGAGGVAGDRKVVDTLLGGLPAGVLLRLDANRGLTLDGARALLDGLDLRRVEYIEEPLQDPLEMPALHFATGVGLALDESLLEPAARSALEVAPGVVAHVLKPSLHGTLGAVRSRVERSARQGVRTTLSNALESALTLRLLARFATWLPNPTAAHGLATGGLLLGDPFPPPTIEAGSMATDEALPTPDVAWSPLEAVRDA